MKKYRLGICEISHGQKCSNSAEYGIARTFTDGRGEHVKRYCHKHTMEQLENSVPLIDCFEDFYKETK